MLAFSEHTYTNVSFLSEMSATSTLGFQKDAVIE